MPNLNDLDKVLRQSVCLYGQPKVGKTLIAGMLAEFFVLDWFDLERGVRTLYSNFSGEQNGCKKEWMRNVNVYNIPDNRADPVAIDTMLKVMSGKKVFICAHHGKVLCTQCVDLKTMQAKEGKILETIELNTLPRNHIVVVDSGTQLAASALNQVTKGKSDEYHEDWEDWRRQGKLLTLFLQAIQAGQYNIIFITHDMSIPLEDGKEKICPMFGTRNHSTTTAKYFDHVVYCGIENSKHKAWSKTTDKPNVLSGSRDGVDLAAGPVAHLQAIFAGEIAGTKASKPSQEIAG